MYIKKILFALILSVSILHASVEVPLQNKITGLYVAFFDRAPDESGLSYWIDRASSIDPLDVLKEEARLFATHPSFDRAYGDLNNRAFVEEIYRNTLGRDGDEAGIEYWTSRLNLVEDDPNYLSRSDFVALFVDIALTFDPNDPQYANLSQEDLDQAQLRHDLLANKVEVALRFVNELGSRTNVQDNQNPEDDPAYKASIKILESINEEQSSVENMEAFLESILSSSDPIYEILHKDETPPDTTPPSITLNGASKVTISRGSSYSEQGAVAVDDVDGNVAVTLSGSVDNMSVGIYTITYKAVDSAGNEATVTREVEVVADTTPPTISLNGASEITLNQGESYSEAGAVATDNIDGNLAVTIIGSVDTSTIGDYTLTYRATDMDGNTAQVIRVVHIIAPPSSIYQEALDYLNSIRVQMLLTPFSFESHLNVAAQAHSDYLDINNILSHYEDSDNSGFYEEWPLDRAVKAQYAARFVAENASAGQVDTKAAIDSLFSAIYHRLAFMNPKWDQIGIGVTGTKYVFDMGNSGIDALCQQTQEERDDATEGKATYRTICLDTDKWIAVDEYDAAINLSPNQTYFVYPPNNSVDIQPVFLNETPDPLPYKSYSGNPVSISFNPSTVSCDDIEEKSFTLHDDTVSLDVDIYTLMDKDNDPNDKFSSCDFAIFPQERLEYAHHYTATFVFDDGSGDESISWSYTTRNPGIVLKVESDDESFDISINTVYYIYIPPTEDDPTIGGISYSRPSTMSVNTFEYYDSNTLKISVDGDVGDVLSISYQGGKKVELKIVSD